MHGLEEGVPSARTTALDERTALSAGAGRGTLTTAPDADEGPEPACGPVEDQSENASDGRA